MLTKNFMLILIISFLLIHKTLYANDLDPSKKNCPGIENLNQVILDIVINPFSIDEKSLSQSAEGGDAFCDLIDFLNLRLKEQDPQEDIDVIALNLKELAAYRNQILKKKILKENIPKIDQIAQKYLGVYQSSINPEVVLHIFLLPTCSKCGKFIQKQIKDLIGDWEKNKEKLGLKIILHPFYTKSLIETSMSQIDHSISAYWQSLNTNQIKTNIDQWYSWYELVISQQDVEFLKDPVSFFKKIFKVDAVLDQTQVDSLNMNTKDILDLLIVKKNEVAPIILLNHQMWNNYKKYPINYANMIDIIKSQKNFDLQNKQ